MTRHTLLPRHALLAGLVLFVSMLLVLTAYTLWLLRSTAIEYGLETSAMHTRSFEDFVTQTVRVSELSAVQVASQLSRQDDFRSAKDEFVRILKRAPYLRSMSLLDDDGRIVASSNPDNVGVRVDNENYLPPINANPYILRIGQPWAGRDFVDGRRSSAETPVVVNDINFIPVTRTVPVQDGSMTLLLGLNPDYVVNHIMHSVEPAVGSVEVLRYDGTLLLASDTSARVGSLQNYVVNDLHLAEIETGRFRKDFGDGNIELASFRASRLYPLVVVTRIHENGALEQWRTEAKTLLAVILLTLLAITVLAITFYRRLVFADAQRAETKRLQRINASVFESSAEAIVITDMDANIISVNSAFTSISGYAAGEAIGNNPRMLASGLHDRKFYEVMWSTLLRKDVWRGEVTNRHKDGHNYDVHLTITVSRDSDGNPQHYIGVATDISEHKKAQTELRVAAIAFESQEGILVADAESNILRVNRAFTEITGYSLDEIIGKNPRVLSSGRHPKEFYAQMWNSLNTTGAWRGEIWNRRKNGEIYPERLTITAVKDGDGKVTHYVASLADITLRKAAEEEIRTLAYFDSLTQLPNRRLLLDRLQQALASCARSGKMGAILFIDLDNFKNLNDTLGHDFGDMLLQQVADRLVDCVREGDTVARLGGDEFVVMLENLSSKDIEAAAQAEVIANKILAVLNVSYQLQAHAYQITPSIGITMIRKHDQELEELLKQADIAMYQSKKEGKNTTRFFDPKMQESLKERIKLENDLCLALADKQFELYLQVQVDGSRNSLGAEALIRWHHPERGLLSPAEFIPHAEESGLILSIGNWVLETACRYLQAWSDDELMRDMVLSINVSAKQFHQVDFVEHVRARIAHYGVASSRLKLELTESLLLVDFEDTIAKMKALNDLGVRLSLDDFGTGYSSLQYLKRLPLEQLKIDKSFIRDIETDADDRSIVSTVIAMARNLGVEVIAEGVETEAQKLFLAERGCNRFQGYLFGRPVPLDQFVASLRRS